MEVVPFVAESAADAVQQIRSRLGPEAVVLNVRPLPARGLARLWRRPRFEVFACRPAESAARLDLTSDAPAQPTGETPGEAPAPVPPKPVEELLPSPVPVTGPDGSWRVGHILEQSGFSPANAQRVVDQLRLRHGAAAPPSLGDELRMSRAALADFWRKPQPFLEGSYRPHVLVGPPGTGKTTCLCKWLTQTVLVEGRTAQVWRLDGTTANTAESLGVYCEILGVPVERSWVVNNESVRADMRFIDLPGVDWRRGSALRELEEQLKLFLSPQVHLVLNAAYDLGVLQSQVRAFSALPIEDLILTHLDEEPRWGKIWNLVLGTGCPVRFLSAGQNIPGDFLPATPERIFARQFPA